MIRKIMTIDPQRCTGCGVCVDGCMNCALHLVEGRPQLIKESYCNGVGRCMEWCPQTAISIQERECEPFSEIECIHHIADLHPKGVNAHLKDLQNHNELVYFHQGVGFLKVHGIEFDLDDLIPEQQKKKVAYKEMLSCLKQWPIKLLLINPESTIFEDAHLVVVADCSAYAYGNFHQRFIKDKAIVIACPKFDTEYNLCLEKLIALIKIAKVKSIEVVVMDVHCCNELITLVETATDKAQKVINIKKTIINVVGEIR